MFKFTSKNFFIINNYSEGQREQLASELNRILAYIMCLIEQSVLNKNLVNENYFMIHHFEYSKCIEYRSTWIGREFNTTLFI